MTISPSATSTGKGDAGSRSAGPRPSGAGGLRQRKTTGTVRTSARTNNAGGGAGMWRFYTEDSPGLKVGPVPVLVMSLIFIASVFVLHILGKYTRS
ncbi:unnamed protein product [Brachionus calyciflorus]|uniref:Protein transport protein Sec61 subunit beta n=1 Tax=Brachionus calyciflorus TaxID=104777 RepID=A0A813M8C6_9BILA|nr:unnamed protein product [Brachionus calyciflorus]